MRVPIRLPAHSKYHAKRTNGYASRKEAAHAAKLLLWLRLGEIQNFSEQVPFVLIPRDALGPAIRYYADFVYDDKQGHHVVDTKGFKTPLYKLKRRLLYRVHGIKVEEV